MIFKKWDKTGENKFNITYHFVDFIITQNPGECFSRILHDLYNLSHEELFVHPYRVFQCQFTIPRIAS
jgi:lipoprotein signal peptidase